MAKSAMSAAPFNEEAITMIENGRRTPRSRRVRRVLFVLAVGGVAALVAWLIAFQSQPSLLAHAERTSLAQIRYADNACWLDANRVVLYGGRGLVSSPLAVLDTRNGIAEFNVSPAAQKACQPGLNAQSAAISYADYNVRKDVNVWHNVSQFRLRKSAAYSFSFTPPASIVGMYPIAVALSPHRDRVAWMVAESRVDGFDKWVQRVFPSYHAVNSVYVCKVDGSEMRCLGSVPMYPVHVSNSSVIGNPIQRLSWTPDGRRVRFLYNDALWTVPAN